MHSPSLSKTVRSSCRCLSRLSLISLVTLCGSLGLHSFLRPSFSFAVTRSLACVPTLSFKTSDLSSLSLGASYPDHPVIASHLSSRPSFMSKFLLSSTNMYINVLLSTLIATTVAAPLAKKQDKSTGKNPAWQPTAGTTATCNNDADKIVGFYVGPQLETVVNDACAAMLPPCAYQDRLGPNTVCIQTVDWPLDGSKSSIQSANVETKQGNKISGWDVKCK